MRLTNDCVNTFVSVPNIFIDKYMTNANGEFVKVYLCLLRCMQSGLDTSISTIADYCALTENDILRALIYWNKANVLALEIEEEKISGIRFLDLNASTQKKNELPKETSPISVSANIPTDTATEKPLFAEMPSVSGKTPQVSANIPINSITDMPQASVNLPITNITDMPQASANIPMSNVTDMPQASANIPINGVTELPQHSATVSKSAFAETTPNLQMPKNYTLDEVKTFRNNPDISELLFVLETYIKHPLSPTEMNVVFFWMNELKFSKELAEYLIEYCVSGGHISLRYMEKVALNWSESNITTVEQAKQLTATRSKSYYTIVKAFGISGRNLTNNEINFITKWTKEYGFDLDIIQEACKRTISAIQKPSFEYADSILTSWNKQNVHTIKDIANIDTTYKKVKKSSSVANNTSNNRNRFNDFPQQTYDYDELEKLLLVTSM